MNTPPAAPPDTNNLDAVRAALQSTIETLEAERKRAANQAWYSTAYIGFGVAIAWLLALRFIGTSFGVPISFAAFFAFIAFAGVAQSSASKTYRDGFKMLVLPPLIRTFGELNYSPRGSISESDFRLCQLFREPEIYNGEDLVEGRIGATTLRASQVHAEYKTRNSKNQEERHTIFNGIFVIADFNKNFPGMTLVLPDVAEKAFGKFGQSLQSLNGKLSHGGRELVKLEDPEFEREFVVYSHDQIEARYILSSALMRRLVELKKRAGEFYISFFAGQVFLAIPTLTDYFEAPPLSKPLTMESLQTSIDQMNFIFGLVHDLDLNTRIWNKSAAAAASPQNAPASGDAFWVGKPPAIGT